MVVKCLLHKLNYPVKEAFNAFSLGVFEEECNILYSLILKPVLTVVCCTVDNTGNIVFPEGTEILRYFLSRYKHSTNYLTAVPLKMLHLEFVSSSSPNIKVYYSIGELLLYLLVFGLLEWF